MLATFLSRKPLADDVEWPSRPSFQQLRESKGRQSFLRDARDEAGPLQYESHGQQRLSSSLRANGSQRNVRRPVRPGNVTSFEPRTITSPALLSSVDSTCKPPGFSASKTTSTRWPDFVQQQTEEGYKLVQVSGVPAFKRDSEDAMALPPHLKKKVPPTARPDGGNQQSLSGVTPTSRTTPSAATAHASDTNATAVNPTVTEVPIAAAPVGFGTPARRSMKQTEADNIRAKLESLGAKVSDPKPASRSLVTYSESTEHEDAMSRRRVPKAQLKVPPKVDDSKPAKPQEDSPQSKHDSKVAHSSPHETAPARGGREQQSHRDESKANPLPPHESTHGGGNGRGRARGGNASRSKRESRWPTAAEQRPDPHRWDIKWEDESAKVSTISDWATAYADAGGAQGKKGKAGPDQHQLADFSGGWAPAPVDWDSRPGFRNNQSSELIEEWLQVVVDDLPQGNPVLTSSDVKALSDLAPRGWVPTSFGNESVQWFWNRIKDPNSRAPECCDKGDLVGVQPWWTTYEDGNATSAVLKPYSPPEIKGIDPHESRDERLARENDHGSQYHADNRKRTEIAKKEAKKERLRKAQEKAETIRKASQQEHIEMPTHIKTGKDLFIRGATEEDIDNIRTIYNHYVSYSTCTPEVERLSAEQMRQKVQKVRDHHLPFLVAYERGAKLKSRRRRDGDGPITLPDKVVGIGFADEYYGLQGMYRATAKLEIYIDSQNLGNNVAKCLVDKLLGLLDSGHLERGGYEIQGDEAEGIGACRVVKNMIIHIPYDRTEVFERKKRWITEDLRFEQVGHLEGIGEKDGRSVSLAIFQRKTGLVFLQAAPASEMEALEQ